MLSEQTGVAVSKLVAFRVAFKQAGADAGHLGKTFGLMSKSIGAAALDGGAAASEIERLGLNVQQLVALSPDQQFVALAEKMARWENPTLRAKSAFDIFGRSAAELLPHLQQPGHPARDHRGRRHVR